MRDDAPELRGLLQALAQQTRPALEVIVVDNGSSDGSAELARAAGCTVLEHPVPIVRCDADSRPSPGWLAAHQHAHGAAGTVLVTGPGWFRLPRPWSGLVSAVYVGGYLLLTAAALAHAPAFGTTMSMPRSWWREARTTASRSPDVHDDMDLSFQVRPGERVRVRRAVGVSMSPRALRLDHGQLLRWRRAAYTLRRNWRRERPWERWRARCAAASGLGAGHREHDG